MANVGAKGIDVKVLQNWDLTKEAVIKTSLGAAMRLGENIAGEADKAAPRDTGTLARSISVTVGGAPPNPGEIFESAKDENYKAKTKKVGNRPEVVISANTPYARKQHENHSSKAKFLERSFNERAGNLEKDIQDALGKLQYQKDAKQAMAYIKQEYGETL